MKLVVDGRAISVGFHHGLGRFASQIISALYKLTPLTVLIYDMRQLQHLPKNIPYIMGPRPSVPSQRAVTKMLNDFGADIVFAPTVFFTLGKRNFKLISSLHDTNGFDVKHLFGYEAPFMDKLQWHAYHATKAPLRATLDASDHIITVSEYAKESIARHKLTKRPVSVIYNAPLKLPHITYNPKNKTVVYMGTFYIYKNVKTLVMAMNYLPGYRLVCLSKIHPKTKANLLKFAKDPSQVIFKNGVTDDEYFQELQNAAALVTASKHEGFGLPLVEAQTMGVPVICSDIPVFHEVCDEGSALFFDQNDPHDFARAVKELPKRANALIEAGHKNAKRFTWRSSAQKLHDIIKQYS